MQLKRLEFLKLFSDSTVVLSGVYYPTSPLILHHLLEISSHLHASEKDQNLIVVVKIEIYKLFNNYERKFGAARSQRAAQPASHTGKKKQAWGRIFESPGSGIVDPSPVSVPTSSSSGSAVCELLVYLDSDNVTSYEDDFDLLLWWYDHKLTYPILSIMARDIKSVPISTVSS